MKAEIEKIFKEKKILKTLSREKILEIFLKYKKPMTLQEIRKKLKDFQCDEATIYRTLNLFEEKKILQSFTLNEKASYFEIYHQEHHHHILCRKCLKIEHLDDCFAEKIEEDLLKKGYTQLEHKIEFFGFCSKCS